MSKATRLWEHPAIAGQHVVRNWRDYPDGQSISVATCRCGWENRTPSSNYKDSDRAVDAHWQSVIDAKEAAA